MLQQVELGKLTDGVNDLVDHDFTELKLLVVFAVANVLGNHGNAVVVISVAITSIGMTVLIVVVECADSRVLANAAVAHCAGLVVLVAEVERLEEEQDGNASKR